MSNANFGSYGDLETVLTGFADRIKKSPTEFVGTMAEWETLSSADKAKYTLVNITDDSADMADMNFIRDDLTAIHAELAARANVYDGKNILQVKSGGLVYNGLAYVTNKNQSVTVDGTAAANTTYYLNEDVSPYIEPNRKYILSKGIANDDVKLVVNCFNGSTYVKNICNVEGSRKELEFACDYIGYDTVKVMVYVAKDKVIDNVTIFPMIRDARIKDDTFEAFAPSNKECATLALNRRVGAHNILVNTAKTNITDDVTFTVNADKTITANGTSSGDPGSYCVVGTVKLPAGDYLLSGCPDGGTEETYSLLYRTSSDGVNFTFAGKEVGKGRYITLSSETYVRVEVLLLNGVTGDNLLFKPMITVSDDTDTDYEQGAMTNRALTESVDALSKADTLRVQLANASPSGTVIGGIQKYDLFLVVYQINSASSVGIMLIGWKYNDTALMVDIVGTAASIFTLTLDTTKAQLGLKATGAAGGSQMWVTPFRKNGSFTFTPMTDF